MKTFTLRALFLALLVTLTLTSSARAETYKVVTLPTGKQIKVLGVVKMFFGEGPPGLMLKYQTDLSIEDIPALEKEADEIWSTFRFDVEKAGLVNGIVSPTTPAKGFIVTTSKSYNFVYVRAADGKWSRLPNKPDAK